MLVVSSLSLLAGLLLPLQRGFRSNHVQPEKVTDGVIDVSATLHILYAVERDVRHPHMAPSAVARA